MFDVIIGGTSTTPLYMLYAGSLQQAPLFQPPVRQSPITFILTDKLSGVHVCATVTVNLIVKGPVDIVPQSGLNPVLTNLQPGPKFNPLGNVFCKSHNQYPPDPPGLPGVSNGTRLVHPTPKFIWKAIIQFMFNCVNVPSV